ncbi:MAG: A/G-specific adenine glycosylase [Lachnospiraceae bacterium]|nr:A/G-specific adenine glycosylase [Lachnospiraceae bacterium]
MSEHLYQDLKLWEDPRDPLSEEERLDAVIRPLCLWYERNKRDLPWRRDRDPYHIWISEIMLQQTRVEAVKPYYERFMTKYPDAASLADADEEELMKCWEGLGYYSRARNLKKAAQVCVQDYQGNIPADYEQLLKLPGIGSYTAGAVSSIAFNLRKPAVDGNVLRVIHRVLACRDDILSQKVKKALENRLEASMNRMEADPGTYNQALMELGACVCIPNGEPLCSQCPLERLCLASRQGLTGEIPWKQPKKPRKIEERTVFVITDGQRILIRQRPDSGLLAGLYELPQTEGRFEEEEVLTYWKDLFPETVKTAETKEGKHIFSHIEWHMTGWEIRLENLLAYRKQLEQLGYLVANKEQIRKEYTIPKAFSAWKNYWEESK